MSPVENPRLVAMSHSAMKLLDLDSASASEQVIFQSYIS